MSANFRGSRFFVWDTNKLLGHGATSSVYMGRNKKTGDEVAVKVFNNQSYNRPYSVQIREFDVMSKLKHDNIVKLLAIEEEIPSRAKVIVMEYCPHGSLYSLLEQSENFFGLAEDEFLRVLTQVTAGVKHLRDNNIIHRDIKPGNILRSVAPDGSSVFKLTDFGAARELQQDEEFLSLYGTDEYLHPDMYERAVLRKPRGQQFGVYVDLWSLGVTFYHTATGSLPFRPYGGRKNKETMHKITAEKDHGIISGVQESPGGVIKYSRDLPLTCRLSRGLQLLITPFLANLLEKDQNKTISFEEFFSQVDDIGHRLAYDAFCPSTFSLVKLYARPRDDISLLRQLITDQTEIPGGAQLLLYEGKVLTEDSRNSVAGLLSQVSPDNPIYVFNKLPEFKPFFKPVYGAFPEIPPETSVDADYPLSKRNLALLHSVKNCIRFLLQRNNLLTRSVKMYSSFVAERNMRLQLMNAELKKLCNEGKIWREQLFASLATQVNMLKLLESNTPRPAHIDVSGRINTLQTLQQTGHYECLQLHNKLQNKLNQAVALLETLQTGQSVDADWNPGHGCLPKDKCIEKMDQMIQKLQKIMSSFREDRNKRQLNNNDEQIHKFDKNKMKEICVTAQTLVDDDCIRKSFLLHKSFKQFYGRAVQIHDAQERLEIMMKEMAQLQESLVTKLRVSGTESKELCDNFLQALSQASTNNTTNTTTGNNNNPANSGDASNNQNSKISNNSSYQSQQNGRSRQSRLDLMLDSLQTTRSSLEEVSELLKENTTIMERFHSIPEQDLSEELKSWVCVPKSSSDQHDQNEQDKS